jgi:multisubunit Na+/H+ antiporter MnhG subunit
MYANTYFAFWERSKNNTLITTLYILITIVGIPSTTLLQVKILIAIVGIPITTPNIFGILKKHSLFFLQQQRQQRFGFASRFFDV